MQNISQKCQFEAEGNVMGMTEGYFVWSCMHLLRQKY